MRLRGRLPAGPAKLEWDAAPTWLLCFGLIVYLGLKGGGFDPLVHDQVGIALWWIVLVGGTRRRPAACPPEPPRHGSTWRCLPHSSSGRREPELDRERRAQLRGTGPRRDLPRRLRSRDLSPSRRDAQRFVCCGGGWHRHRLDVGLLSRLHPGWFPEADQTALFLSSTRERLSYPLNYWNGIAGADRDRAAALAPDRHQRQIEPGSRSSSRRPARRWR